jgi:Zn-dependent protease
VGLAKANDVFNLDFGKQVGPFGGLRRGIIPFGWFEPDGIIADRMLGLPLAVLISRAITLVIAFSVHEFAHAWSADQLGDDTPRANGRLTLNPLAHLDPIGSLLLIVAGFGWARPVPINPYELERRTPAGTMLVAAAGPLSNLMLAVLASIPFRAGFLAPSNPTGLVPSADAFMSEFIWINLVLLFFNLIPIAPLDGEKVLEYFLPSSARSTFYNLRPYGPMLLMLLIFVLPFLGVDLIRLLIVWPTQQVYSALLLQ